MQVKSKGVHLSLNNGRALSQTTRTHAAHPFEVSRIKYRRAAVIKLLQVSRAMLKLSIGRNGSRAGHDQWDLGVRTLASSSVQTLSTDAYLTVRGLHDSGIVRFPWLYLVKMTH